MLTIFAFSLTVGLIIALIFARKQEVTLHQKHF
jgi:hypothetical protein